MDERKRGTLWDPVPRDLARRAAAAPWTPEAPAPEVVGYLHAWACLREGGECPSRRDLAAALGWTSWKARSVLARVAADWKDWSSAQSPPNVRPTDEGAAGVLAEAPPSPRRARARKRGAAGFRPTSAQSPPAARPTDEGAAGVLAEAPPSPRPTSAQSPPIAGADRNKDREQGTGQDPFPSGMSRPPLARKAAIPASAIWDEVNRARLDAVPGARPIDLTDARRRALVARVQDSGADAVALVWRWALTAADERAAFLRGGGYLTPETLHRASKFPAYLDRARAWEASLEPAAAPVDGTTADEWAAFTDGD
jgi:hypothetical protein